MKKSIRIFLILLSIIARSNLQSMDPEFSEEVNAPKSLVKLCNIVLAKEKKIEIKNKLKSIRIGQLTHQEFEDSYISWPAGCKHILEAAFILLYSNNNLDVAYFNLLRDETLSKENSIILGDILEVWGADSIYVKDIYKKYKEDKEKNNRSLERFLLEWAIISKSDKRLFNLIINVGVDPDYCFMVQNEDSEYLAGPTLLHSAIEHRRRDIVEALMALNAKIETEYKDENNSIVLTPLILAVIKNDLEIVKILVESGANITHKVIHPTQILHPWAGYIDEVDAIEVARVNHSDGILAYLEDKHFMNQSTNLILKFRDQVTTVILKVRNFVWKRMGYL